MIRRRHFVKALAAATVPLASRRVWAADPVPTIGVLTPSDRQWDRDLMIAALGETGHDVGTSLRLDVRSAKGDLAALPALARSLVGSWPDLIVAINSPATQAAIEATSTIPIVAGPVGDPVASGFATSLARPGRNVTGFSNMTADFAGKRLGLLKEAVPFVRRIAVFYHPDELIVGMQMDDVLRTAPALGVEIAPHAMRTEGDLVTALDAATAAKADSILRLAGQALSLGPATARLSLARRLPAMLLTKTDVLEGGLLSYYPLEQEQWSRMAALVDRILKGAKPSELPFEQPTRFELVVNLKTAAALGLTIPPSILIRADEVIE